MRLFVWVLLIACAVLGEARAEGYEPAQYLEKPAEVGTQPGCPIATSRTHLVAHWIGGNLYVRGLALEQQILRLEHKPKPTAIAFTGDQILVTGDAKGVVRSFDLRKKRLRWESRAGKGPIGLLHASQESTKWLACSMPGKAVVLRGVDGEVCGDVALAPTAYGGKKGRDIRAVIVAGRLVALEAERLRSFVLGSKGLKKEKELEVSLPGPGFDVAPLEPGRRGTVVVACEGGLFRVDVLKAKKPKPFFDAAAGQVVRLSSNPSVVAGLVAGGQRVTVFAEASGKWSQVQDRALSTVVQGVRVDGGGRWVYYVQGGRRGATVQAFAVESGEGRSGPLPSGASGLAFSGPAELGYVVNRVRRGRETTQVWRYRLSEGGREKVVELSGELLRVNATHCLIRDEGALKLVARADGAIRQVALPEGLASRRVLLLGERLLLDDEGQGFTLWEPASGRELGTWPALSPEHVALSPDGARVVTVRSGGELVCLPVAGKDPLWSARLGEEGSGVSISGDGEVVHVGGVGTFAMEDGRKRYAVQGSTRLSGGGAYVLADQLERRKVPASILAAGSGEAVTVFPLLQAGARVRTGLELLAIDPDAAWLLLRRHGERQPGAWLYARSD